MHSTIQIHGHRGCRGYYPENTIEGFKLALELGATAVELDIVVSKDNELIVSHEPYMNHLFCQDIDGNQVSEEKGKEINLYNLTLSEIQQFNCGARIDNKYPEQIKVKATKPSLEEVVTALPDHTFLNIEVKSERQWYDTYQPETEEYARLVADFIAKHHLYSRCLVQSFDPQFLNDFYKQVGEKVTIGLLVECVLDPEKQLKLIDFKPTYFNPDYTLLKKEHLEFLKSKGIKTLVWTVNEPKDIALMLAIGVDGIISDYPDRVVNQIK